MAVPTTSAQQFFRLVAGHQFSDDFSDPNQPWTACFPDAKTFELSYLNGAVRIVAPTPRHLGPRRNDSVPLPAPESVLHADFSMSVDILDWDENAAEMEFGLVARATPPPNCAQVLQSFNYMGEPISGGAGLRRCGSMVPRRTGRSVLRKPSR